MAEFCVCVCVYMNMCVRLCTCGCVYAVLLFAWLVLCCCLLGTAAPTNYTTHAYHISVIYNLHSVILVLISRVVSLCIYIFFKPQSMRGATDAYLPTYAVVDAPESVDHCGCVELFHDAHPSPAYTAVVETLAARQR